MKKSLILIFILLYVAVLSSFQIEGRVEQWQKSDFIGYDNIGDNKFYGDISTVFARKETGKLFLRVTFDDMCERMDNHLIKDNFVAENLKLQLNIEHKQNSVKVLKKELAEIRHKTKDYEWLRTPESNLLEIALAFPENIPLAELVFHINILAKEKLSDSIVVNGASKDGGGNCAFVHHGNQGLTYTEVFYGQYPQESSGFDEILEVHQATGIPGNFHMSGTLIPAAEWHNPEFNDWLITGVQEGWAAMMTSALGQHIMPFMNDDMNNWSVSIESDMVEFIYGYNPKVAWVPERVWLSPDQYPDAGVIDWIGDNWAQHGVEAVVLDDWPHLSGASNTKIHWMNNGSGINLRVIPINNDFVGKMHYDVDAAKNQIWNTGQYGICVYGTDWEVAAEMNEHNNTSRLDNYENFLWWCQNNYPAVNVWKLDSALGNADFNGTGVDITPGTYGLLGGADGYGGSNNSWYSNWAGTASHSDYHNPVWNYGYIWNDAYNNLVTAPDNTLSQLGWYTMMINLHETGWHDGGSISGWEHRYSSHIKNANVYTEASRWAAGQYTETTAAYFSDIDHDGGEELVMYNDKVYAVFEGIGGKINWLFYKNGYGGAFSVIGSDVAYWAETDGDYNEANYNHFAGLSDVNPNQQSAIYDISIEQSSGDVVQATLTQWGVKKTIRLETGTDYFDVIYDFYGSTGYIKSGFTPGLLDIIWSGKSHLQRLYGDYGKYVGWRNSSSGASVAYVLGSAGGSHQGQFEGTLVMGDEIKGTGLFSFRLFAGYTGEPYGTGVEELNQLAAETVDLFGPRVENAYIGADSIMQVVFNEELESSSAENPDNYSLNDFTNSPQVTGAKLTYGKMVTLKLDNSFTVTDSGTVTINNVKDLDGNITDTDYNTHFNTTWLNAAIVPHIVGNFNGWASDDHTYDLSLNRNGYWTGEFNLEAGSYQYKILESDSWGDDFPGANQTFSLGSSQTVKFSVNSGITIGSIDGNEYVFHEMNPPAVVGNFLSELGGSDWNETTSITHMNDDGVDGDITANDGIFSYKKQIPAGSYEFKIALNNNWDQNTSGVDFSFSSDGIQEMLFTYDMSQNSTAVTTDLIFASPSDLTASIYDDSIVLNWDEPRSKALSYYNIYRDDALIDTTSISTYTDTDVSNGESYSYYITAVYIAPDGESDASNTATITFQEQAEISAVVFLDSTESDYTNFALNPLPANSSLFFEAELNGIDTYSNSDFSVTFHYAVNDSAWTSKSFDWFTNLDSTSLWRCSLSNDVEIQNGDTLEFYVAAQDYTGNIFYDNNESSNYTISILGLAQPVEVTFTLNMGGITADSVAIQGDNLPLSWTPGSTIMVYDSSAGVYTAEILFPKTSPDTIQYKYSRYANNEWKWEILDTNRQFVIDDSDSVQVLTTDNWSDYSFPDLYGVTFLDSLNSLFTNFADDDEIGAGNSVKTEIALDGIDSLGIANFSSSIYYKINDGTWQNKNMYWVSNDPAANKSYWQAQLENPDEVTAGDSIAFYFTATDYNGPVFTDDNEGQYYIVTIDQTGLSQAVKVDFSIKTGSFNADSVAIMGSISPLNWTIENLMDDSDSNNIFEKQITFPAGSDEVLQYKFKRYDDEQNRWIWEDIENREVYISDADSLMTVATHSWNNTNINEISALTFLDSTISVYTNFIEGDTLEVDSNIDIEAEIDGIDWGANSDFVVMVYYKSDSTDWQSKDIDWFSNDTISGNSYWRCQLENGKEIANENNIQFYLQANDYTNSIFTDDNAGSNYNVFLDSNLSEQAVTVSFELDLQSTAVDSVSLQGNISPLSWTVGSNLLTDTNSDNMYDAEITFPANSEQNVEYKYAVYIDSLKGWQWESINNRSFQIDDTQSEQQLSLDVWNNGSLNQINGITFLDETVSEYTNFSNSEELITGSTLNFEAEVDGIDANANSEFEAMLNYTTNDSTWRIKNLDWYSNNSETGKSYWRTSLENGNDISNGDTVQFYFSASDYTGTVYYDNNSGNDYAVSVSAAGINRDVTVIFSLNIGLLGADTISIQGNTTPLSWSEGSTTMSDADSNKIYQTEVLFSAGSNKQIEYKYSLYNEAKKGWTWEEFSGNRTLTIDDSDSVFAADTDFWNRVEIAEISGVYFLSESYPSEYTNFENNGNVAAGDSIKIEVEVLGADFNGNSGFEINLHYKRNAASWLTKAFNWYSNAAATKNSGRSYWRVSLDNGSEIIDDDIVQFYISAVDYNGPQYYDGSTEDAYTVAVGEMLPPEAPQNVALQTSGNHIQLSWNQVDDAASYKLYRASAPDSTFQLIMESIVDTTVVDSNAALQNKYFYFIKAVK